MSPRGEIAVPMAVSQRFQGRFVKRTIEPKPSMAGNAGELLSGHTSVARLRPQTFHLMWAETDNFAPVSFRRGFLAAFGKSVRDMLIQPPDSPPSSRAGGKAFV